MFLLVELAVLYSTILEMAVIGRRSWLMLIGKKLNANFLKKKDFLISCQIYT